MGLSAVPLPTKIRRMLPGCQPVALALGADTWAAPSFGAAGSPLLMVTAGVAVRAFAPSSRRLAAATVHANGAATGVSPVLRDPSDDSGVALTVLIVADAAARADAARAPERAAPRFGAGLGWADSAATALAEPDEPAEPVVSATANGIDATAEPTPNATANAPTRPTTTKPDINDSSTAPDTPAATASGANQSTHHRPPETVLRGGAGG